MFVKNLNSADIAERKLKRSTLLKGMLAATGAIFLPGGKVFASENNDDVEFTTANPIKSIVFLNMSGGMSHLDTLDPKQGMTPFSSVQSSIKGIKLAETFSKTAKELNRIGIIRSTWSEEGDHGFGSDLLHTGYRRTQAQGFPDICSMGSLFAYARKRSQKDQVYFPSVVTIGDRGGMIGRPGFLGVKYSGFHIGNLDNPVNHLKPSWGNFSNERMVQRGQMLQMLNDNFKKSYTSTDITLYQKMFDSALEFMNSNKLAAFDLTKESEATKAKFGNHWYGKAFMMAKRLVAAEVPFIEITAGGWDTHGNNRQQITNIMKDYDPAFAAFLGEMGSSGLLKQTLVVLSSEFGRTPDVGSRDGRDHYPWVWSTLIGGGTIPAGVVVGESDAKGEKPLKGTRGAHWRDIHASIYKAAGIDPEALLTTSLGRPFPLSSPGHKVLSELVPSQSEY